MSDDYNELLDLWFSERVEKLWFNSTQAFDDELKNRFEPMYRKACDGELDVWLNNAKSALTLVILFDQLPLNIYRKQPASFATEDKARQVAQHVIANQWEDQLDDAEKAFLFMPFMHSENLQDQDYAIALFEKAKLTDNLKFARHHRDIVARFGRFPHRNAILGRKNTPDEEAYLNSDQAFTG